MNKQGNNSNYLPSLTKKSVLLLLHAGTRHLLFVLFAFGTVFAADVQAGADVDYVLTTQNDPVRPGHVVEFDATVRNLSASAQSVTLNFTVPDFTTYFNHVAGTAESYTFVTLQAGESKTVQLRFLVVGSGNVPPDGTVIALTVTDNARATSTSRNAVVQSSPALNLQLSTEQGTVAPASNFTYTLATSNISGSSVPGATLTVMVPAGASFVSADGGGTLGGGTVTWNFGTLPAGANRQVHVTFQASAVVNTPLGSVNATLTDSSGHVAHASDTRVIYSAPAVQYTLTAAPDPIKLGHVIEYDLTVHNLTAGSQSVRVDFTVPEFTTYFNHAAGTAESYTFVTLPAGESKTVPLLFLVTGSGNVPPNGTTITLNTVDLARGASISRSVVVEATPRLNLQVSTEQATVAPGQNFTYTLAAANTSGVSLAGTTLSAAVPAGASFVSADGGGQLNGSTVTWNFATLAAGANKQVHVTFQVNPVSNTPLGPLDATVTDIDGDIARASDTRVVYSAPFFEYILTANPDPVKPGHVLEYDLTVHNLTAGSQSVRVDFTVPEFTTYFNHAAGTPESYTFVTVPAGESKTVQFRFEVVGSGSIPPNGTTITLNTIDLARGASVSRSVVVQAAPRLSLQLSSAQGTVAPGGNFTYTLAAANISGISLVGTTLSAAVPAGATFVSADGGGSLSNGIVTWNFGSLSAGANERVHVTFQAGPPSSVPLGPLDAMVVDSNGDVARASDTRVVYSAPFFEYTLTATPDPVAPGQVLEYDLTVHNLTAGSQSLRVDFTVPEFTTYFNHVAGTAESYTFVTLAAGASMTVQFHFAVVGSGAVPPNGTSITLNLIDLARGASVSRTVKVGTINSPKADFNSDLHPDWILSNPATHQTAIWFMNDGARISSAFTPTPPFGWGVADAEQFGGGGTSADLLLYNSTTRATAIWYMSGPVRLSSAYAPTISAGWTLLLAQDFNGDQKADLLLFSPSTRRTAIWYLNGAVRTGSAYGPTLPAGWTVTGTSDFNLDGKPDLLLFNNSTHRTAIWYLNGAALTGSIYGPTLPSGWTIGAVDDFNRDGQADLAIWNPGTHQCAIWHLNNAAFMNGIFAPSIPAGWILLAPK